MVLIHADGIRQISLTHVAAGQFGLDGGDIHPATFQKTAIIAISIIAKIYLLDVCDFRIQPAMDSFANNVIDALGGTSAVHRLTHAPISTVHSWRKNGIPLSRLAHLKLIARQEGKAINWETGRLVAGNGDAADHIGIVTTAADTGSSGNAGEISAPAGVA